MGNKVVEFSSYTQEEAPKDVLDVFNMLEKLQEQGVVNVKFTVMDDGKIKMVMIMEQEPMYNFIETFKNVVMKGVNEQ
jgi:hypothetical protein